MVTYNKGEIIQPKLSREQGKELRKACRFFNQSYPAMLARPKIALKMLDDFRRADENDVIVREEVSR